MDLNDNNFIKPIIAPEMETESQIAKIQIIAPEMETESESKNNNLISSETESESEPVIENFSQDLCNYMCTNVEKKITLTNIILVLIIIFLIYIIYNSL